MNILRADEIDFEAHEWETDCRAKVQPSRNFYEKTWKQLQPSTRASAPSMFSSKLKHCLQFRPGEVTAWAGYNGHRKSMFTGQVALEMGLQGVRSLVCSFEMLPELTLARMARQHTANEFPSDAQFGSFMEKTDDRLWMFDHFGRISPKQCLAVCHYFAKELGGQQIWIDSFMMVVGSEERSDEQKQFTTDLVRLAQETGTHVHVIAHCRKPSTGDESQPPGKYDLRGSAAITDQCSNVVTVWANKAKKARLAESEWDPIASEPDAAITVCKQRNSDFEGRLKFWFDDASMRFTDERGQGVQAW